MQPLLKVECLACGGRYYVIANDLNLLIPPDIKTGEAFPNACPFCEDKRYAVIVEEEEE